MDGLDGVHSVGCLGVDGSEASGEAPAEGGGAAFIVFVLRNLQQILFQICGEITKLQRVRTKHVGPFL